MGLWVLELYLPSVRFKWRTGLPWLGYRFCGSLGRRSDTGSVAGHYQRPHIPLSTLLEAYVAGGSARGVDANTWAVEASGSDTSQSVDRHN